MERDLHEIWKEIRAFKNLKPAEQKKALEELEQQVKGIKDEISANSAATNKAEKDLRAAEERSESIGKEYLEMRERRQNAVALDEDDKQFKVSASELKEEQDLIEDRCVGLKRRIENLRAEGDLLEQEKTETKKMILRFRLIPFVGQWNEIGEQLAGILKQIIALSEELGESFFEFRTGAQTIFYSRWEGIDCIAKFYVGDEVNAVENRWPSGRLKDIFNFSFFTEDLSRERKKGAEASK